MTDREAQVLLVSGWAMLTEAGWSLYDPAPGDASAWTAATEDEVEALESTLLAYPAIAAIHQSIIDHADGHRGDCQALRYHACTCRQVP